MKSRSSGTQKDSNKDTNVARSARDMSADELGHFKIAQWRRGTIVSMLACFALQTST